MAFTGVSPFPMGGLDIISYFTAQSIVSNPTYADFIQDLTETFGFKNSKIKLGEALVEVALAYLGNALEGALPMSGETSNDGTNYNFDVKGAMGIMNYNSAVACGLYSMGIAIDENLYQNEDGYSQYQQILDDMYDKKTVIYPPYQIVTGKWTVNGEEGIPYLTKEDGSIELPVPFLEWLYDEVCEYLDIPVQSTKLNTDTAYTVADLQIIHSWNDLLSLLNSMGADPDAPASEYIAYLQSQISFNIDWDNDIIFVAKGHSYGSSQTWPALTVVHSPSYFKVVFGDNWDNYGAKYLNQKWTADYDTGSSVYLNFYSDEDLTTPESVSYDSIELYHVTSGGVSTWSVSHTESSTATAYGWSYMGSAAYRVQYIISCIPKGSVSNDAGYTSVPDALLPNPNVGFTDIYGLNWLTNTDKLTDIEGNDVLEMAGSGVLSKNPDVSGTTDVIGQSVQSDSWDTPVADTNIIQNIIDGIKEFIESMTKAGEISTTGEIDVPAELTDSIPTWPTTETPTTTLPADFTTGTIGVDAGGIAALYNPTTAQLSQLNQYLWTDSSISSLLQKMFVSPIDCIISLFKVYAPPVVYGQSNIVLGYVTTSVSGVNTIYQYSSIDCGSITIPQYFYNILDYNPHTKIALYLPFIGFVDLDTDDVMGGSIHVGYGIDMLTGDCLARVTVTRDGISPILYTFSGNCAVQIPVTGGDLDQTAIRGALRTGLGFLAGAAAGSVPGMIAGSAAGIASTKVSTSRSGSVSGNAGVFGPRIPYVVISRPIPGEADYYNGYYGYTANKTVRLGTCTGFTRVRELHLDNVNATESELDEIDTLLREGVII